MTRMSRNEVWRNLGGTGSRYHTMKTLKSNKKEPLYEYQIDGIMARVFKTMYNGKIVIM